MARIPNRLTVGWLGSRVVSVLDSGAVGPGFKSQPRRCRVIRTQCVAILGSIMLIRVGSLSWANCSYPSCLCSSSSEIGSSRLKGCEGNCRLGGK